MSTHPPTTYTGPSAATMMSTHTLAAEIIARAHDEHAVLDAEELALLKEFCSNPTSLEHKKMLLQKTDLLDREDQQPGDKAKEKGSLVGYVIAVSVGGREVLGEGEVEMLRGWFGA